MNEQELLTVEEVAEFLRVAPNTVYRWCRAGKLSCVKLGKEWRIMRRELDVFLARRTASPELPSLEALLRQRLTAPEHILVMASDPDEVYRLQAEFLKVGLRESYPLFVGAWWQRPALIRVRLAEAGLPVAELEASGQLAIGDLQAAHDAHGARGAVGVWKEKVGALKGGVLWGTGSHRLSDWNGRIHDLIRFETELHEAFRRLPVIALCPCMLDPVDKFGFDALLDLVPHHSGALFTPGGVPMLMRTSG